MDWLGELQPARNEWCREASVSATETTVVSVAERDRAFRLQELCGEDVLPGEGGLQDFRHVAASEEAAAADVAETFRGEVASEAYPTALSCCTTLRIYCKC